MNRLQFSIKQFYQLVGILVLGLIFIIYLNIQTSNNYTLPYIPDAKHLQIEKEKSEQLRIDLIQAKENFTWKVNHPIPELHTGLKNMWYDRYGIEKDVQRNKYGAKINSQVKKVEPNLIVPNKKQQKMIKYEDWIDEVDTPQVKPIDPDPIILQKEEMIKEANEQN